MTNTFINVHDLCVSFNNKHILEHITLDIQKGSFNIIIGPNGGGKTTFIKSLLGLIPFKGKILFNNLPIKKFYEDKGLIGYVPQRFWKHANFPITLYELIDMGLLRIKLTKKEKEKRILSIAEELEIKEFLKVSVSTLSFGQIQKGYIAAALVSKPDILILDECTSALDPAYTLKIMETMVEYKKQYGMIIIMVSHDLSFVPAYVDNVICIKKHLVCHGIPAKALQPENLKMVYDTELKLILHTHTYKDNK